MQFATIRQPGTVGLNAYRQATQHVQHNSTQQKAVGGIMAHSSGTRFPVTLRLQPTHIAKPAPIQTEGNGLGASLLAAACFSAILPMSPAEAQSANPGTALPALTVEAPAIAKPKPRLAPKPARPAVATTRPARPRPVAAVRPAQSAASSQAPGLQPARSGDASPFANAAAPYKVERSSSGKLTEPLVNTARTVTAIPKEILEQKNATSLRELVRTTPGLTLGSGEGGNAFGDRVLIRGFDARNDMFIDGIRDSSVTTRETFMVEQVEITKGPAGSISGRGTTGGSLNMAVKKPTDTNFQTFAATLGTDMTKRITADINQKLGDTLTIRANGMWQNADVAERDELKDKRWGGSASLAWKPFNNVKLTLDYHHIDMDQTPDWGVPFDVLTKKPITESGVSRKNYYGLTARDFQKGKQDIATLGAEIDLNENMKLTSKLRYGATSIDYVATAPGTPNRTSRNPLDWTVPVSAKSRYQTNDIVANQTELTTKFETFGLKHTLVGGFEISDEKVKIDTYTGLATESFGVTPSTSATLNLWSPYGRAFALSGTPTRTGRPTEIGVQTQSAYVIDTINWRDIVYLNGGLRFDRYETSNTPFAGATLKRDDNLINYNVGLTYKVLPNASIYAAYGTSSNPVGSELDGSGEAYGGLSAQNAPFRPERNKSAEIGTKWELFNKQVLFTASLFQTTKDNARESFGTGATATLVDTAAYRVRGLEFGLGGNVTDKLSLFGGAVFMDSEQTKSLTADNIGQKLANIAHQSFNLLAKYQVTDKWSISGQATYKSEIFGGTLAAAKFGGGTVTVGGQNYALPVGYNKLPAGWRFDIMSEYKFNKTFSVDMKVLNVANTKLYDAFYRSNAPYVYIAPGRAAYLTVKATF